jgi:hypothetical protein
MRKDLAKSRGIKRSLRVGFIVGFLLLFSFNMVRAQENRAPKVSLVEDMFDFKEVVEGEIINHSFTITNKGNETLKILQVKPG